MVQTALSIRSNYKAEKCPLCEDTGSQEVTAALYKDIIGFLADARSFKETFKETLEYWGIYLLFCALSCYSGVR